MAKLVLPSERVSGGMLGFAVGDAFGHPIRQMTYAEICERYEKKGCLELAVSRKTERALFTDATQMTLFTADGILWADKEGAGKDVNYSAYVFYAYQLWLYTQTKEIAGPEYNWLFGDNPNHDSRLLRAKALYRSRNITDTNIDALKSVRDSKYGRISVKLNANKDNGGLKRVLPAGLYFSAYNTETAFRAGADFAAITHGSPNAYLSAGCYSAIIAELMGDSGIEDAVRQVMQVLRRYEGNEVVFTALDNMLTLLDDSDVAPSEGVRRLGTGESAEEALAIALFCAALHKDSYTLTVQLAANQDGASDVAAALAGGLVGTMYGAACIPTKWLKKLQYLELITEIAEDLAATINI